MESPDKTCPNIKAALCANKEMHLEMYVHSVKLDKLAGLQLPPKIAKLSEIYQICESICALRSFSTTTTRAPTGLKRFKVTLQLVISLLISLKQD